MPLEPKFHEMQAVRIVSETADPTTCIDCLAPMKQFLAFAMVVVLARPCLAQTDDTLSATLPNGKVLHFATPEAKAKFLAARERSQQLPASSAPATLATSSQPPTIALDVSSLNAGSTFVINWMTDYGSYDYTGHANKALDLHIRNLSARPGKITLQWIFTARVPMQSGRFIFDIGSHDWDLQAGQDAHLGVRSEDLSKQVANYAAAGFSTYRGADMDGWLVVVRHDDKIIKSLGSTPTLEALVGKPDLDQMIATYNKASRH